MHSGCPIPNLVQALNKLTRLVKGFMERRKEREREERDQEDT